jgi:Tfp pilus assembly protein FimV
VEEIKLVIEDELARLHQENERLRLVHEQMTRRSAVMKRAHIMQHQIEQKRAVQAELQRAIEALRQQEHKPSTQVPSSPQPSLQQ